jgi:hypothetical protein
VHLWLLDSGLPAPDQGLSVVLSQQQLEQCRASWEQQLAAKTALSKTSDFQREVFAAAQQLPADLWQELPALEQVTADGAFSIDIAATTASGVRVAIEADGPTHFIQPGNTLVHCAGTGRWLLGAMQLSASLAGSGGSCRVQTASSSTCWPSCSKQHDPLRRSPQAAHQLSCSPHLQPASAGSSGGLAAEQQLGCLVFCQQYCGSCLCVYQVRAQPCLLTATCKYNSSARSRPDT